MSEMSDDDDATQNPKRWNGIASIALVFVSIAFLYLFRLDTPLLWSDEAENAAMSRNVQLHGYPVGFDGRNLLTFGNCGQLGEGLVSKRVTWLQYYVGAASQEIFGTTTAGSRALFAILGALTFFPLLGLLRSRVEHPVLLTGLLLLSPQVILFQRNGRYFPLLILLSVSLLYWLYQAGPRRRSRYPATIVLSILLFHTHPLMAAGLLFSLIVSSVAIDRERLPLVAWASALGFGSWLVWFALLPGTAQEHLRFHDLFFSDFKTWLNIFSMGWVRAFADLDYGNSLPMMAIGTLLLYCGIRRRSQLRDLFGNPLVVTISIDLLVQTASSSALIGGESRYFFAPLRYMPHLSVLLGVALYLLVRAAMGPKLPALAVFALISGLNVFDAAAWLDPAPPRQFRWSWWPSVYSEILNPPPDALREVLDRLPPAGAEGTEVLRASPMFMADTLTFYVGKDFLISPYITPGSLCERDVIDTIGKEAHALLLAQPDLMLAYQSGNTDRVPGFEKVISVPYHRLSPDATRPELNRRSFHREKSFGYIVVYRRFGANAAP